MMQGAQQNLQQLQGNTTKSDVNAIGNALQKGISLFLVKVSAQAEGLPKPGDRKEVAVSTSRIKGDRQLDRKFECKWIGKDNKDPEALKLKWASYVAASAGNKVVPLAAGGAADAPQEEEELDTEDEVAKKQPHLLFTVHQTQMSISLTIPASKAISCAIVPLDRVFAARDYTLPNEQLVVKGMDGIGYYGEITAFIQFTPAKALGAGQPCSASTEGEFTICVRSAKDLKEPLSGSFETDKSVLQMAVLVILLYLLIGITVYSQALEKYVPEERDAMGNVTRAASGWTVNDAAYFCFTTLLTIGYGDLIPTSTGSKLFTAFYAVFAVAVLGSCISIVIQFYMSKQEAKLLQLKEKAEEKMAKAVKSKKKPSNAAHMSTSQQGPGTADDGARQREAKQLERRQADAKAARNSLFASVFSLCVVQWLGIAYFYKFENLSDSTDSAGFASYAYAIWYYSVITMTTVGYGDISPMTYHAKIFFIFWGVFACVLMLRVANTSFSYFLLGRKSTYEEQLLTGAQHLADFSDFDKDGDGSIDMYEFVTKMLQKLRKVDQRTLELLEARFKELDVDGSGTLDIKDFQKAVDHKGGGAVPKTKSITGNVNALASSDTMLLVESVSTP